MSSLKCDRWPRPNLERAVWPRSAPPVEYWFYKPCGWPLGGRPAACSPTGALWCATHDVYLLVFIVEQNNNTRLMALCPGLPGWASNRKVKPIWILLKQETVSGSGISWATCKSTPRPRQIRMPASHHSSFFSDRMPFLLLNQQCQSTVKQNLVGIDAVDLAVTRSSYGTTQEYTWCHGTHYVKTAILSTKPEVQNIWQQHQRRTEPQPLIREYLKFSHVVFLDNSVAD